MFWVDILNKEAQRIVPGPIITGTRWHYTQRLSRAGEWTLEVPAGEPRLEFATFKRQMHCYDFINGQSRWMGGGALEKTVVALHGNDAPLLAMDGNDVMYDLTRYTVNLEINWNSPFIGAPMYTRIFRDAAFDGWTVTVEGPTPNLIVQFVNQSVLNALVTICEKTGQMFRLDPIPLADGTINFKHIKIFSSIESSGILAIDHAAPLAIERNINACLIENIEQQTDAFQLTNIAYPYGSGTGGSRFTPYGATMWPDGTPTNKPYVVQDITGRTHAFTFGFSLDIDGRPSPYFISDDSSITQYGGEYPSEIQFKDITPITSDSGDITAAANALVMATVNWLINQSQPQEHYTLSVAGLRKQVYPGQSIRVVARQMRDGKTPINIDQDLIILEVVNEIDATGIRPVSLTVSTNKEFATTDAQVVASEITKSLAFQAHPQTGPSGWTQGYREDIDQFHGTEFPVWLSNGTLTINSVVVRFRLDRLRSTVRSVGSDNVKVQGKLPPHSHDVKIPQHTHPTDDHQHSIQISDGTLATSALRVFGGGGTDAGFEATGFGHTVYAHTDAGSGSVTVNDNTAVTKSSENSANNIDLSADLSGAISAVYGIYEDTVAPYGVADLTWTANGQPITVTPILASANWYKMDVTSYFINAANLSPLQEDNTISVAVSNPKEFTHVRVTVQIEIRNVIQSIAVV